MPILVFIFLSILLSSPCFAAGPQDSGYRCPDKVECKQRMYDNYGNSSEQTLGTMDVKC